MKTRTETDTFGPIEVAADRYWGAQTERSRNNFRIGDELMPRPLIAALAIVKRAAAETNRELGLLDARRAKAIVEAAQEIIDGKLDDQFPLVVWQTGSGTQTNMNVNEVIANRAMQLSRGSADSKIFIHPTDDVNRSQSSNDIFPTVMYVSTAAQVEDLLIPAVLGLRATFAEKSGAYRNIVMLGRTHLQDAVPLTLGQVISGWVAQLDHAIAGIRRAMPDIYELAIGGTAVGTGLNAPLRFGEIVGRLLAAETGKPFSSAPNKFFSLSAHDAMVASSGAMRTLAGALMKIANDLRWYASGPNAGIGELSLPANEPGSSIMPGKVNPTQCEALTQVAVQVFGNDHAVAFAGSQGNFQLNAFKPVILHNVLESAELLAQACLSFEKHCARGFQPNVKRIQEHLESSLMLVTALSPRIGYDPAAAIALAAQRDGTSLREAAVRSGYLTAEQFDDWVRPEEMTHPPA